MATKKNVIPGKLLLLAQFDNIITHKSSVRDLLINFPIPEYFWKAVSSTTGKYHPTFALGEGGLLRHTLVNMYYCGQWGRFLNASDGDVATAVCAAALHDSYKGGYMSDWNTTVPDHPFIAAHEIRKFTQTFEGITDGQRQRWNEVADAVWTHMGVFTASPRNPKNGEFVPVTLEEMSVPGKILALSDYAASRKIFDELDAVLNPEVKE